ncbi:MAG: hypothetical protein LBI54_03520 [Lachnospiraceae bacterium]|nr:hypothetical protein [Lachnospiraceae bacterium]
MLDWNEISQYRENNRLEAKAAVGGLPRSLWEALVDYLAEHGVSKTSELSALLEVNASRTKVYLQELIAEGIVVAEGANRNRTYRLK